MFAVDFVLSVANTLCWLLLALLSVKKQSEVLEEMLPSKNNRNEATNIGAETATKFLLSAICAIVLIAKIIVFKAKILKVFLYVKFAYKRSKSY